MAMGDSGRSYSYDQLHDRFWQIVPAAWVIAKSSTSGPRTADLEDVQMLLAESGGATVVVKIKFAGRGEAIIQGTVSANGHLAISQPEVTENLGSIFDHEATHRFAAVIVHATGKR
jgi:hypothetical protein